MSHKKAGGSTALGRDSNSQRLGVKAQDGQHINAGSIIIRQRGTKFKPGKDVKRGKDDTLYAAKEGYIKFNSRKLPSFTGKQVWKKVVSIVSEKPKHQYNKK